ncbi:MAG: M48 family metalloprotease [Pseudomonadota bacterium]
MSIPNMASSQKAAPTIATGSSVARLAICLAAFCLVVAQPARAQVLLRDVEIERWIDDYSLPIFYAAGLPAEQINILLIGDPTPNAFAGGLNMGIHTGLLTTADTPNQIAGVIAHEAGHIAGGHTARSDEAMAAATRPLLLSLVLAAGAAAAGAPQASIGLLGLGQNIGLANALEFSRGQEASADQAAITYLDRVGVSSRGLIEFFGKLRNFQVITGRRVNPYLQTHPLATERMTALRKRAEESPHYAKSDTTEDIFRLNMIQAKIKGFLQEAKFTLREYPEADQSAPARYARAVAYYRSAQIDPALAEINSLLAEEPENPYFHELKGQMLFEFGRIDDSIAPHRQSVALAPDEALLRINLGRALIATEDKARLPEAVEILKSALALENDNALGWFELARAHGGLGNLGHAHLATAESKYNGGAMGEAAQFALRAQKEFKPGQPEYRRATDIIAAAKTAAANRRRR